MAAQTFLNSSLRNKNFYVSNNCFYTLVNSGMFRTALKTNPINAQEGRFNRHITFSQYTYAKKAFGKFSAILGLSPCCSRNILRQVSNGHEQKKLKSISFFMFFKPLLSMNNCALFYRNTRLRVLALLNCWIFLIILGFKPLTGIMAKIIYSLILVKFVSGLEKVLQNNRVLKPFVM